MEEKNIYFKISNKYEDFINIVNKNKNLNKIKKNNISIISSNKIYNMILKMKFEFLKFKNSIKIDKNENIVIIFYRKINTEIDKQILLKKINKKIEKIYKIEKNNKNNLNVILSKEIKNLYYNIKSEVKLKKQQNLDSKIEYIKKIIEKSYKNKKIYKKYLNEIIKRIIIKKNEIIEEQSMYILLNSLNIIYINWLTSISTMFKNVNIITENIKEFKKIENYLEKEFELVSIMNNKRKSLIRAKYIINIDFNDNQIKKYNINREAIIFNISSNKIENLQGFNGYVINNIKINCNNFKFDVEDIFNKNNNDYKKLENDILNNLKQQDYYLVGNNTIIEKL